MGCGLAHPAGGPDLGLRLDPDRAARPPPDSTTSPSACPDKAAIDRLARRLDALGQPHAGVHRASMGWILPEVLDPDGHTLRFYTMEHHTDWRPARSPRSTTPGRPPNGSSARKPATRSARRAARTPMDSGVRLGHTRAERRPR